MDIHISDAAKEQFHEVELKNNYHLKVDARIHHS
jgi:hypothetical protein